MSFKERTDALEKLSQPNVELKKLLQSGRLAAVAGQQYTWDWLAPDYPNLADVVQFQQIVNQVRPTLIVETGIARGGSLALSASLLVF